MKAHDQKKQLRNFGFTVGGIFAGIGVWPVVLRAEGPRLWALTVAAVLVIPALVMPRSLTQIYRIWMAAAEALSWINTRILLSVVFYGLVTPIGMTVRRFGRDPMQRGFQPGAETYRVSKPVRAAAHMTRQF